MSSVLEVNNLVKHYVLRGRGTIKAVNGINLFIKSGETLGLVGESGCGKSTVGRCIIRLESITSGSIFFESIDIAKLSNKEMWAYRRNIQMVFQDPFDSLNPRITVGEQVEEPLKLFGIGLRNERKKKVIELFEQVGLGPEHIKRYPHQLSGGQLQRVGIARALATSPKLIILDEPTTALDVSIQANILNLLKRLQLEMGVSFLLISHDISVIGFLAHRIAVMYLGKIVEEGPKDRLLTRPYHPYTMALLSSLPRDQKEPDLPLVKLGGEVPSPFNLPNGCPLVTRCPFAIEKCHMSCPELRTVAEDQRVACHRAEEIVNIKSSII